MASLSSSSTHRSHNKNHNHTDHDHTDQGSAGVHPEEFFRKLRVLKRAASVPTIPSVPADPCPAYTGESPDAGTAPQQQQQQQLQQPRQARPSQQGQEQPQPFHRRTRSEGTSSKSVRFRGWGDDDHDDQANDREHDPSNTSDESPGPGNLRGLRGSITSPSLPSSSSSGPASASASAPTHESQEAIVEDLPWSQLETPQLLPRTRPVHGGTPRVSARIAIFFVYKSVMFTLKWACLPIITLTLVSILLERLGILALRFFLPRILWLCVRPLLTGLATSLGAFLGIVVPAVPGNTVAGELRSPFHPQVRSQEPTAGVPPYYHHHHHHYQYQLQPQLHDLFAAVVDGNGYGGVSSVYGALLLELSQGVLDTDTNHLDLSPADREHARQVLNQIERASVQHHSLLNLTSHLASFVNDRLPGIAWPLGILMGDIKADPAHDHAARCWTGDRAWEVHMQRLERLEAGRSDMSSLMGDVAAMVGVYNEATQSRHPSSSSSGHGSPDTARQTAGQRLLRDIRDELRSSRNKRRMEMSEMIGESVGAGADDHHAHHQHGARSRPRASWTADNLYRSQQRTDTVVNSLLKMKLGQGMGASTLGQTLKVWDDAMVDESAVIIDWWDAMVALERSIPANKSTAGLRKKLQQEIDGSGGGSLIWVWSGLSRVWRLAGCRCQYTHVYSSDESGSGSYSVYRWRVHISQERVAVAAQHDRQIHDWARGMVDASERAVCKPNKA